MEDHSEQQKENKILAQEIQYISSNFHMSFSRKKKQFWMADYSFFFLIFALFISFSVFFFCLFLFDFPYLFFILLFVNMFNNCLDNKNIK